MPARSASGSRARRSPRTPRRKPGIGSASRSVIVSGSAGSAPCITSSSSAQSSTLRAIGPGVSSVPLSGSTPYVDIRPIVVFSPVIPHHAAGMRTDPPVSVPIAHGAIRAPTATPEPEDDPPGARCTFLSQGLRGVPMCWFVPQPP